MTELVDEQILRKVVARRIGGKDVVEAAASVGDAIRQDDHVLVRRPRRDVAPRATLEREDVALARASIVGGAARRPSIEVARRTANSGLRRWSKEPPDV